jgi:hypothetical protein
MFVAFRLHGSLASRIRRYIEWNPVMAGLAANPEEFPWCSAAKSDAA